MKNIFTLLLLFNFLCCFSQQYSNVNYAGDGQGYHNMDIYLPDTGIDKYPVVVYIYGSAWYSNNGKGADMTTVGAALLDAGFAVVTPNHRSSSDAKFPAQIHDIKAVIRFLRGNSAQYKLDTSFIATSGSSSGGHLASLAGTTNGVREYTVGSATMDLEGTLGNFTSYSSEVDAVVDFFGPIDFMRMEGCTTYKSGGSPEADIIGGDIAQNQDKARLLSAITYVDPTDPPFLLFHGGQDAVVPYCQSEFLYEELQNAGVQSEYVFVPNGQHGPGVNNVQSNLDKMVEFMLEVKNSATPVSEPPIVSITSPASNESFLTSETISIFATASDPDGHVVKVEFYDGSTLLGADDTDPYSFEWSGASAGNHSITAVAMDDSGVKKTSAAITITIEAVQEPYNGTPHQIPGRIEFEEYDLGGNGTAYNDDSPGSETNLNFREGDDVDIETCTDDGGGYNLGYAKAGEWLEYTVNVVNAGIYDLHLRVAANGAGRTISLTMDAQSIASNVEIPNTGGWQTWTTVTIHDVELEAGTQIMRVTIGNTDYVNLNYMEVMDVITGVPEAISNLRIFPNPFQQSTTIEIQGTADYTLNSPTGLIKESGVCENSCIVGKDLPTGLYFVNLESEGVQKTVKLIKK